MDFMTNYSPKNFFCSIDMLSYGFMYSLLFDNETTIQIYHKKISNALFMKSEDRVMLSSIYYLSKKLYWAMSRFARLYKIKYAKKFNSNTDLCLCNFDELPQSIIFDIYDDDNRTLYKFRMSDLIQIINNALANSPDFFSEPLPICNPYTNVPFKKSHLYYIYFKLKHSSYVISTLFHEFFLCDFNLKKFKKYNECLIRDCAISNYIKMIDVKQHVGDILDMIELYNKELKDIQIHDEFPVEILYSDFKEYIPLYVTSMYTFNPLLRDDSVRKLQRKMIQFGNKYPQYGRKIYNHDKTFYFNHCDN